MRKLHFFSLPLLMAGCTATSQPAVETAEPVADKVQKDEAAVPVTVVKGPVLPVYKEPWTKGEWFAKATVKDQKRILNWQQSMKEGRSAAIKAGYGDEVQSGEILYSPSGPIFKPKGYINHITPPAGMYNCAISKLGGKYLEFIAYPAFRCQIIEEDGRKQFVKLTGSQRQIGYFYGSGVKRWDVFLGTIMLGDDAAAVPYGKDEKRDEPAIVQRIGEQRWRMVFPYPEYESTVDVMELTPVGK